VKKKRRLLRSDTFWGLTAALFVVLQFWWLPGEDGSASDSYSTTVDGKLGLYRTLSQLFPRVERDSLLVVPEDAGCLVLIAPDRYPNDQEQELLYEFVYGGGTLIFAPNWGDPESEMRSLGIQTTVRPDYQVSMTPPASPTPTPATPSGETAMPAEADELDAADLTDSKPPLSPEEVPKTPVLTPAPGLEPDADEFDDISVRGEVVEVTSPLSDAQMDWNSNANLEVPSYLATESLVTSASGEVEAATWPMGTGRVIACSSPDVFSNRSMLHRDSRRLAVRLVERGYLHCKENFGDQTSIVLSEFFNASDAYQQTGVLFSPSLRIGTLQLLLVAVLGIWLAFYRFGPAEEVSTLQRRSLTESAQAVGNLQYRLNDGGPVIHSYLEYIRSQLRRRYGSFVRLDQPELLASRAGMDPDEVRERLAEAQRLTKAVKLSPDKTASSLRWLVMLQQRLAGNRENNKS
jgi:hypothetical protein